MKRILDVRTKSDAKRERSRVLLEPRLADLFRRVCSHLGLEADEMFEAMLALYIEQKTDLEMVFDPSPEAAEAEVRRMRARADAKQQRLDALAAAGQRLDQAQPPERRQAERRTKKGTAALWTSEGNVDRRTKGNDRRRG